MLSRRCIHSGRVPQCQQGMVLLVALIVLVAITVAGIALIRSVDTTTLVAGNLAFQQAAIHASDTGVERAIAVLKQRSTDDTLNIDDETNGYFATLKSTDNPAARQSWQAFWQATWPHTPTTWARTSLAIVSISSSIANAPRPCHQAPAANA